MHPIDGLARPLLVIVMAMLAGWCIFKLLINVVRHHWQYKAVYDHRRSMKYLTPQDPPPYRGWDPRD
jgi:hypothetical protein